jgi:hypothetical protein
MLFDLRGRGRRRTVQAIYLGLALLMGGGLVGFGIGGNSNGGGIFDAIVGSSGNGDSATSTLDKRIKSELAATRRDPRNPALWAQLTRLRYQRATLDGLAADQQTYTAKGKATLRLASDSWEHYLALNPKTTDSRVARLMVQVYAATGIDEPTNAVKAMEIVTAAEKPPSSNLFAQLAQLAYQAGQTRTGDLASGRAVDLADKSARKALKAQLDQIKTAAATAAAQAATTTTG